MLTLKEENFTFYGYIEPHQFSFDHATLEKNLRTDKRFSSYERANPATWPLITQSIIDKYCGSIYTGEQPLPKYVAYEPSVVAKFLKKWPKKALLPNDAAVPLHKRYPCNFSQKDIRKTSVGMSKSDAYVFIRHMKQLMAHEPWHYNFRMSENMSTEEKSQQPPSQPSSGRPKKASRKPPCKPQTTESTSQDAHYIWNNQYNAALKNASTASNEDGEGPYATEVLRAELQFDQMKGALFDADWEYALTKSRAMDAEQKLLEAIEERIGQEERVEKLEALCAELMSENKRLRGASITEPQMEGRMAEKRFDGRPWADKRARCEDYFSEEEEERPEKRMRSKE